MSHFAFDRRQQGLLAAGAMALPLMLSLLVQSLYNIVDAFSVRPDMAHKVTGKCVISAANAVFVFQKIQLLFGCVG